jgi:hypothetical protein
MIYKFPKKPSRCATLLVRKNKAGKEYSKAIVLCTILFSLLCTFAYAQVPFKEVPAAATTVVPTLPQGMRSTQLFAEGDTVWNMQNLAVAPAKGNHDYNAFVPTSAKSGLLYVGHETNTASNQLGDGGGATLLLRKKITYGVR